MAGREHRFGTGIAYRTIPSGFPVFWAVVPGCCRNSYGTSPNLWVQKEFIKFRQRTQNAWLRPVEFLGKFFSDPPFNFFRNLRDVLLGHSRIEFVLGLTVPCFYGVPLETAANFLLLLNVAIFLREKLCHLWSLNWILNVYQKWQSPLLWVKRFSTKAKQLLISKNDSNTKGYKFI